MLMGRLRFIAGAFGIIAGFFVYQYGLFLTLNLSPDLSEWTLRLLPWMGSVAVMGAALQLAGGVLVIAGLLFCIVWVGSQSSLKLASRELPRRSESDMQTVASARKCKFCEATMEPDSTFCPKCQRAQV